MDPGDRPEMENFLKYYNNMSIQNWVISNWKQVGPF
jgi:hypothetical protein